MGCGCGGGAKRRAAKLAEPKTDGKFRIEYADGGVEFHDSRVAAQAHLIRSKREGVVVRND